MPPGARLEAIEVIVSVTAREIRSWTVREGVRPALLFGESLQAILGVQDASRLAGRAAPPRHRRPREGADRSVARGLVRRRARGGAPHQPLHRVPARVAERQRVRPSDRGLDRVLRPGRRRGARGGRPRRRADAARARLVPPRRRRADARRSPAARDRPARGPELPRRREPVRWQRWSFRVGFDPYEGLVLHTVGYHDGDRVRSVLHRASVCEMVVPYGDPGAMHGWKNAFDAGEWGLGRMANSLKLGCDCLGVDPVLRRGARDRAGRAVHGRATRSACTRRTTGSSGSTSDQRGGTDEVRRSRRLVVSFIATVGNYEYGFYWYLYLDGNIQLEVKLTGIVSTMAITPGRPTRVRQRDRPRSRGAAPPTSLLGAPRRRRRRLRRTPCTRSRRSRCRPGPTTRGGTRSRRRRRARLPSSARNATRTPATSRVWKVVNPRA